MWGSHDVCSNFASSACGLAWIISWIISPVLTTPIVDLGYAQYQGYFDAQMNITNFLGIRYAAPPVGMARFQAPQPPVPKTGVQPAMHIPSECYQAPRTRKYPSTPVTPRRRGIRQTTASDDCLYLSVFVPGTMDADTLAVEELPVLVWIHGGGYHFGNGFDYNGAQLVADSLNSVIVVEIQYRLGLFGFLSGDEVKAHGALNAGLLDQNFALQWIQDHIESFGGDKDHVTIWGESAGAGSVLQHIVANRGDTQPPLFNAAIASSTFLPSQYDYNHQFPQSLYDQVVNRTGCGASADTFSCLQSVDTKTLQAANLDMILSPVYPANVFVPVVDGDLIVERPTVTLSKGQINGQALLAVANEHEGTYSIDAMDTWTISQYISTLFPDLTPAKVEEAAYIYREYGTAVEQVWMVYADTTFVCPTYHLLGAFVGRSWKGLFAIPPAFHADDLNYYFSSESNPPPYNNRQFTTAFSQSFISLAKGYDVNAKFDSANITPYWDKYSVNETEMLFNRTEVGVPIVSPIRTDANLLRRFWASVSAEIAQ